MNSNNNVFIIFTILKSYSKFLFSTSLDRIIIIHCTSSNAKYKCNYNQHLVYLFEKKNVKIISYRTEFIRL